MAGIGDHHIQLLDVVGRFEVFDGGGSIGFAGAIDFHDDELAVLPFGKVLKRFGAVGVGIADGSDDGGLWP